MHKNLLWVLPGIYLLRISNAKNSVIDFSRKSQSLIFGIGFGLLLGIITIVKKTIILQPIFSNDLNRAVLNAVILSSIFEEFLFRGAILTNLKLHYNFLKANLITSLLFLGMHLPGWYFQNKFESNVFELLQQSLIIFLLSLLFGYVAKKTKNIIASMFTHILNNFFNL